MTIDFPKNSQIPGLRRLWQQAFGDGEEFLDLFFSTAFSPERCRCVTENGAVTAALYWFDCLHLGKRIAYIYAVATNSAHQGRGLCRALMADTHALLQTLGYAGTILVPGEPGLFQMYGKMGYRTCSSIREFTCAAGESPVPLTPVPPEAYARLRRELLPEGGVVQEGENLDFLAALGDFYSGTGFCLWVSRGPDALATGELLGDASQAPGIAAALGAGQCRFRTPGNDRDFAMYRPITDTPAPTYLGFAFD